jgi:radical SAM-linked protein
MRHLSHRELITHVTRAIRRAGVMVEHTKGFHPLPRISFGPPLGVGVAGLREYFDMDIIPAASLSLLRERMNSELSEGVELRRIAAVGFGGPSLQEFVCRYEYEIICPDPSLAERFMKEREVLVEREKGSVDIRPMVQEALLREPGRVVLRVRDLGDSKVRLDELLQAVFGVPVWELEITRLSMSGRDGREPLPAEERQGWQVAY